MMSSSLSLLFLLQLGHAVAGSWADHALNNGTMTHNNETVTSSTSLVPTASPAPPIHQFHVGVTRAGRRYQTGRRYWAFSGDDAIVTDNINDAAWFHYQEGYLKSEDKYVNIDGGSGYSGLELSSDAPEDKYAISKDDDGNLELTGADYTVGKGHGIFCTSDDGNVFVIASKRPPFRCHSVNLRSRGMFSASKITPLLYQRVPQVPPRHPRVNRVSRVSKANTVLLPHHPAALTLAIIMGNPRSADPSPTPGPRQTSLNPHPDLTAAPLPSTTHQHPILRPPGTHTTTTPLHRRPQRIPARLQASPRPSITTAIMAGLAIPTKTPTTTTNGRMLPPQRGPLPLRMMRVRRITARHRRRTHLPTRTQISRTIRVSCWICRGNCFMGLRTGVMLREEGTVMGAGRSGKRRGGGEKLPRTRMPNRSQARSRGTLRRCCCYWCWSLGQLLDRLIVTVTNHDLRSHMHTGVPSYSRIKLFISSSEPHKGLRR